MAPLLLGDADQRMRRAAVIAALLLQLFGGRGGHQLVLDQPVEHLVERQPVTGGFWLNYLLHWRKTIPQTSAPHSPTPPPHQTFQPPLAQTSPQPPHPL